MRKYLLLIISLLLFIPTVVFADEEINIESINLINKSEDTVINTEASTDGEKIDLDIRFFNVDDYANYKIIVKNNSDVDLLFHDDQIVLDKPYIGYDFIFQNDSRTIEANSEKEILLKVYYKEYVPSNLFRSTVYDGSSNIELSLNDSFISVANTLRNIGLGGIAIIVLLIAIAVYLIIKNKKGGNNLVLIFLLLICISPKYAKALKEYVIPINSNVSVKSVKETACTFEGNLTQGTIYRPSSNSQYIYSYMRESNGSGWTNITEDGWGVVLANSSSTANVTETLCSTINGKPIVSMSNMFSNSKAQNIDLSSFVTDNVVRMTNMFTGASNVRELDFRTFDTSKVTIMAAMFSGAYKVERLELGMFDTSSAITNSGMFSGMTNLEYLNMDNWDISKISGNNGQLSGTTSLKEISAKNWIISNSFSGWTYSWNSVNPPVEKIDVTGWDLTNTTSINSLFYNNSSLKEIVGLDTWDTSTIQNIDYLFSQCGNLEKVDMSSFELENVTGSINSILYKNPSLKEIKTPKSYPAGSFRIDLSNVFKDDEDVISFQISTYDNYVPVNKTLKMHDEGYILDYGSTVNNRIKNLVGSNTIKEIKISETAPDMSLMNDSNNDISYYATGHKIYAWQEGDTVYIYADNHRIYMYYDSSSLFSGLTVLEKLDLSDFDASLVTNTSYMFYNTSTNATSVLIEGVDSLKFTKPVKAESMFASFGANCNDITISNFKDLDVSKFYNIEQMFSYFGRNSSGFELDLSGWDLSNAETVRYAFDGAGYNAGNVNINISNWKIGKATELYGMMRMIGHERGNITIDVTDLEFPNATSLVLFFEGVAYEGEELSIVGLETWDTKKIQNFYGVFCDVGRSVNLVELDLSSWDMSSATSISYMLKYLGDGAKNTKINISNWKFADNVYTYNFSNHLGRENENVTVIAKNWDLSNQTGNMTGMFQYLAYGATGTVNVDLSNWNLDGVTSLYGMFSSGLSGTGEITINVSGWNTSTVTNMSSMFSNAGYNSTKLTIIGLDDFDTSNVTNMSYMFYRTGNLKLNGFNINPNTNISGMFNEAKNDNVVLNIKGPISYYSNMFKQSSGGLIKVNYDSNVTNIDDIIATREDNTNVVKGDLIED